MIAAYLKYVIGQTALVALLYCAIICHMQWAENVLTFLVWMMLFFSVVTYGVSRSVEALRELKAELLRGVPESLSWPIMIVIALIMASAHWYWMASAYILAWTFMAAAVGNAMRFREPE